VIGVVDKAWHAYSPLPRVKRPVGIGTRPHLGARYVALLGVVG